jgi:hypothetical protein
LVSLGRSSGSLLLTGGLLVRIQPEELTSKALRINNLQHQLIAVSNFHSVSR